MYLKYLAWPAAILKMLLELAGRGPLCCGCNSDFSKGTSVIEEVLWTEGYESTLFLRLAARRATEIFLGVEQVKGVEV